MPQPSHPLTAARRKATVTAVNTGPPPTATITIGGDTDGDPQDFPYLDSYLLPQVGDDVATLEVEGSNHLIIGRVVQALDPLQTYSGVAIVGAYDATKPIRTYYRRQTSTSDTNALIFVTLACANLLYAHAETRSATAEARYLFLREDQCSTSQTVFQLKNLASSGANMASTPITFTAFIQYQI